MSRYGFNPERHQRDRTVAKARSRALQRLARIHYQEYRELLDEECRAAGVDTPRPYVRDEQ